MNIESSLEVEVGEAEIEAIAEDRDPQQAWKQKKKTLSKLEWMIEQIETTNLSSNKCG